MEGLLVFFFDLATSLVHPSFAETCSSFGPEPPFPMGQEIHPHFLP